MLAEQRHAELGAIELLDDERDWPLQLALFFEPLLDPALHHVGRNRRRREPPIGHHVRVAKPVMELSEIGTLHRSEVCQFAAQHRLAFYLDAYVPSGASQTPVLSPGRALFG